LVVNYFEYPRISFSITEYGDTLNMVWDGRCSQCRAARGGHLVESLEIERSLKVKPMIHGFLFIGVPMSQIHY
jgi:hypothetical protein